MNDPRPASAGMFGIAAVERDTGLSKDLLRVWERRYGFPAPLRNAFGERCYPADQVERLALVRRLIDAGHRPGRVVALPADRLRALLDGGGAPARAEERAAGPESPGEEELQHLVGLLRDNRIEALRHSLAQPLLRLGLERFVLDVCAPLTRMVGECWARGEVEIYQEHLYTEQIQSLLRSAIGSVPLPPGPPVVVLATLPNEVHGLGLLMAEALLVIEGCRCVPLGTCLPSREIAAAAAAQHADVVALSCSGCPSARQVAAALADLRAALPPGTGLWVGGSHPVLHRRPPGFVTVVAGLRDIRSLVDGWRNARRDLTRTA